MNRIIAEVEAEIALLQAARALLARKTDARKVASPGRGRRGAATRSKMAEALPPETDRQEALWGIGEGRRCGASPKRCNRSMIKQGSRSSPVRAGS